MAGLEGSPGGMRPLQALVLVGCSGAPGEAACGAGR